MINDPAGAAQRHSAHARVLLVADWTVDPHDVVAEACRQHSRRWNTAFGVLVPAWLHGLDWAGDPHGSVPCARRQLVAIQELAAAAGLPVESAAVGDPEPVTAIYDATRDWPADEVLIFARARHFALRPLDLEHRARRSSGLPVRRVATAASGGQARRSWARRPSGHCVTNPALV